MNAVEQPWYGRPAPERLDWYPAWCTGYEAPVTPRSWKLPGLTLLGLTIVALGVWAWWLA